jgi:glutathione S-transferase
LLIEGRDEDTNCGAECSTFINLLNRKMYKVRKAHNVHLDGSKPPTRRHRDKIRVWPDKMLTLYHCMSARSFRPLWTLEELGLSYQLVMLPFPPRVKATEYLAVNPLGTVPGFIDGDTWMTESAAICEYLASRYDAGGLSVLPSEPEYGRYLNMLHFGEATLTFPQTLLLRYGRFEPPERRQPQVVEDYSRWFMSRLKGVGNAVATTPYVCGARFTVADISVGYALMLAEHLQLDTRFSDPVREYWSRIKSRKAFLSALEAQQRAATEQGVPTTPAPLTS